MSTHAELIAEHVGHRHAHAHGDADCHSFLPGHRLHWTQWKHAAAAPHLDVMDVHWHDDGSFEVIAAGRSMHWRHHDPYGLKAALDHATLASIEVSPQWRALRIDGAWFNCAPADASLTLCEA